MFFQLLAVVYVACSIVGLYLNWKMHKRFKASDELKEQNRIAVKKIQDLLFENNQLRSDLHRAKQKG